MIRCSHCNAQVPDGTRFCDQCGRPLTNAPAPPAGRPVPPAQLPVFDSGAGREHPSHQAEPSLGPAARGGAPGAPRAMPQPPPRPGARPAVEQPATSVSDFKLPAIPSLPSVARPPGGDLGVPAGFGGRPGMPVMPTAPVPEIALRPRATLAFTEAQTPYMLSADRDQFVIGREDPIEGIFPDVDLTLSGGDEAGVSRRHAMLTYRDGSYWLEDLDSRNYTFVNSIRLEPHRPRPLRDGDEIEFGTLRVRFYLG